MRLRSHSPQLELERLRNHNQQRVLLRNRNQQRLRMNRNGCHSEPSVCLTSQHAFRRDRHKLAQERHNRNLRQPELHKVLVLELHMERALVHSKVLVLEQGLHMVQELVHNHNP